METAHKLRAWHAWQTASLSAFAYHDPKKMPTLDSLTGERRAPRVQTPEEMKAVFDGIRRSMHGRG